MTQGLSCGPRGRAATVLRVADELVVGDVLAKLSEKRQVFHSEADLQFAFAWTAKVLYPGVEVRLETHPEANVRLDLQLSWPSLDRHLAIELKYMTRRWTGEVDGEPFDLKGHGAQDIRGYDVVKDIERVERFVEERPGWGGYVIVLSNDPSYWRPRVHARQTNADAFRLCEGSSLSGQRAWGPRTGVGTSRGREEPIALRGEYTLRWQDFSSVEQPPTEFRSLVVPVTSAL